MSQTSLAPVENRLLARLPAEEYERLLPHLEQISLALGEVIYESGGQQSYIYFPTTAIISLLYMMENGSSAEMGVAGNEGLVGIALFIARLIPCEDPCFSLFFRNRCEILPARVGEIYADSRRSKRKRA